MDSKDTWRSGGGLAFAGRRRKGENGDASGNNATTGSKSFLCGLAFLLKRQVSPSPSPTKRDPSPTTRHEPSDVKKMSRRGRTRGGKKKCSMVASCNHGTQHSKAVPDTTPHREGEKPEKEKKARPVLLPQGSPPSGIWRGKGRGNLLPGGGPWGRW